MTYELKIERRAQKALARVPETDRNRIIHAIRSLADEPRPTGSKKLSGRDAWRIRIGDYRVLYEIHDTGLHILVVRVGHRSDVYRG